jgi:3-oxoacyl-[acyl-carrier protein] reductase
MTARRALITGASSGIGTAAALELAREGAALWITYAGREAEALRIAEECRAAGAPDVHVSRLDLRERESIDALVDEITATWGSLHVLVNNGGVCPYTPYDDIEFDEWDMVLETNARGTFFLTASKGAILAITRSFARHLAAEGIRVNAVTPGPVASAITDQLQGAGREKLEAGIPLGAFGQPEDVAWIIASLASERARFITGATYDVNGGVRID